MDSTTVAISDNHVPEELFLAANLSTVRLTHLIKKSDRSSGKLSSQSCLFCRQAELLSEQLPSEALFGVTLGSSCTAMEKLYEIFRSQSRFKWVEILDVPKVDGPQSRRLFSQRLGSTANKLATVYGYQWTPNALQKAIRLCNRFRALLLQKGVQRAMCCGNDPISLTTLPGKIKMLEALDEPINTGPRLMILGSRLREDVFARAIEAEGGVAALFLTDDGYYDNILAVREDMDNPFDALAAAYMGQSGVRRSITALPDVNTLTALITRHAIDGILTLSYPFCVKMNYDIAWLKKHETGLGVPVVNFQLDSVNTVPAGLHNRIGAFVEMINREN